MVSQKKLGNFLLFDVTTRQTILTIVNCKEALQIILSCMFVTDNFLFVTKTLPCTTYMTTCRVANSLRHVLASSYKGGWGQRDIFFQFFDVSKTQKNMHHTTHKTKWSAANRNATFLWTYVSHKSKFCNPQTSSL